LIHWFNSHPEDTWLRRVSGSDWRSLLHLWPWQCDNAAIEVLFNSHT
jgi:hypothetical protein